MMIILITGLTVMNVMYIRFFFMMTTACALTAIYTWRMTIPNWRRILSDKLKYTNQGNLVAEYSHTYAVNACIEIQVKSNVARGQK